MKSFRKLVSEVAQPKAEDEINFKAKHEIEKFPHSHAGDETFKGNTKKAPKRRADYEEGNDEAVYEAKKMDPVGKEDDDIDNDGDVDSSDKYLHARRKAIAKAMKKEEVEQLDELSPKTLTSYAKASYNDALKRRANRPAGQGDESDPKIGKRLAMNKLAHKKGAFKEEAEQLDELSPNTLHSYIKGASKDLAKRSSMAGYDARSRAYNNTLKNKKKADKRMAGIASASGRLADKANMAENAWEEVPMMMRQLQFIEYAAGEISDYLNMGVDPEEWFQNKLAGLHQTMLSMYAYAQGEMKMSGGMYGEEVELDESQRSLDAHKFKQAAKVKAGIPLRRPGESLVAYVNRKAKAQAKMQKEETEQDRINKAAERAHAWRSKVQTGNLSKSEKDRINKAANKAHREKSLTKESVEQLDEATPTKKAITRALQGMKVQPKDKVSVKKAPWEKNESLDEVTRSAVKRPEKYTDARGVTRTRMTTTRPVQHDQYGQEKIRESLEQIKKHHVSNIAHFDKYPNGDTALNIHHQHMAKLHGDAASKAKSAGNKKMADAHFSAANAHHSANGTVAAFNRAVEKTKQTFNESVELEEAVKPGRLKLDDGSSITVSKKDADLLNQMFNDLNSKNRKMMQDTMMSDKVGFEEIVGFAREAL